MKRYRGQDANFQRFGSAFVPAHKWGKRNKRQYQSTHEWVKALMDQAKAQADEWRKLPEPEPRETYEAIGALLWPIEPIVTADGTRRWVWKSEPTSLEYTLPQAQDPDWSQVFKRRKHND